jgi:4-hydroxy-tetrahydrodipicolinate synthase
MADKFLLRGIITALVTPFSSQGEFDEEALREIIRFQLRSNVNGLFPMGTTGLGPVMHAAQRRRVAEVVVEECGHRLPVIIQVGAADPGESLELATHAEKIGADAIASLTPFYYQPGETAIIDYFRRLSEATTLPILIYNIPRHTGNNVDVNLLLKLSRIPRIVGIKDSSRDFSQLLDYLQVAPDGFSVINGTDSYLFSAFCAGAQAGVSATANPFPELFVELYETYRSKNFDKGAQLQLKVHAIRTAVTKPPIAPLFEAMKLRGLRGGFVKAPLRPMTPMEVENLRASISRIMPELKLASPQIRP